MDSLVLVFYIVLLMAFFWVLYFTGIGIERDLLHRY